MAKRRYSYTITTNTTTYLGKCPANGCSVLIDGTFDSATATLAYKKGDGTVVTFADTDATGTSDFEASIYAGQGTPIYIVTSGGGASIDIDVLFAEM